jgi:TIR domain
MADIFISYKKEDAGRVIRMVEALRAEGFDVWWDHGIKAGSEWDRSIHQELYAAKAVIAIWSHASVAAPWVKEEATVGKNRGVLIPVRIDEVDPPLGFMMIQAADLVDWSGDRADQRWAFFLEAVRGTLRGGSVLAEGSPPRAAEAPPRVRPAQNNQTPILLAVVGIALIAVAAMAWMLLAGRGPATVVTAPPGQPSSQPQQAPQQAPQQQPQRISEGEQKLWDQAVTEKTRQGFQSYLVAYPNGAYAQRARDTLLTCRTETNEVWKPGPDVANQMVRGVSGGPLSAGVSAEQHCSKAKADVYARAKLMCEAIVTNGGYRNAKWTVADAPCDCQRPNTVVMTCIADLAYSCRWEMRVTERTEICG